MARDTLHRLPPPPPAVSRRAAPAATARALARDAFGREVPEPEPEPGQDPFGGNGESAPRREPATESLGRRAGALSDELDFPEFVASLVHGTFDAIVDSSIRQMESFADLVASVAKPVDQFTQENVSLNQARDWLVGEYPHDLQLARQDEEFRVVPRPPAEAEEAEARSPDWLRDFGLEGEELTPELVEEQLLPQARERVARNRLQTLSTIVLLGMNRVVVRDGSIAARLRFRAAAADRAHVEYAVSDDPGGAGGWGQRGSSTYAQASTKVSTVGVNVQTDSELKAELFGEVKINFASETVPLERFVDDARRTVLERHARATPTRGPSASAPPSAPAASTAPAAPVAAAPAPAAPAPVAPGPAAAPGGAR